MMRNTAGFTLAACLIAGLMTVGGCGPDVHRGGEGTSRPRIDEPAMSLTLDKLDIDYLVDRTVDPLMASPFWSQVRRTPERPLMAIWPIYNATTQHLEDQMDALLSSIETHLVNTGDARMVSRSQQEALAQEVRYQHSEIFNPETAGRLGRMLGATYFVTGRVTGVDERLGDKRRVQYRLFIQVLEVDTGLIVFQNQAERTKFIED